MTVGELISKLADLDQDQLVVLDCDPERSGYRPLGAIWMGLYDPLRETEDVVPILILEPEART